MRIIVFRILGDYILIVVRSCLYRIVFFIIYRSYIWYVRGKNSFIVVVMVNKDDSYTDLCRIF